MLLKRTRLILSDCWRLHKLMEDAETTDEFRPLWVSSLMLLRTAADVIRKEPHLSDTKKRLLKEDYLENKASPHWKFIKTMRDLAVHEYQVEVDLADEIPIAIISPDGQIHVEVLGENLYRPLANHPFSEDQSLDARDVYGLALNWFEGELTRIEEMLSEVE